MGYAIAAEAVRRGASVTLVSGPTALDAPEGVVLTQIQTTQELLDAMMRLCDTQHVIIQAAAPADYRFVEVSAQKLKKHNGEPRTVTMVENPDVAQAVAARKQAGQTLVGFAAETNNAVANAQRKLRQKGLDLIVANDVTLEGAGFDVDTNIATLIHENGLTSLPLMSKQALAAEILDAVMTLRGGAGS
jgi:phosphopantothenoylcysteine decarboxylase/phosphopantothenate--cysteine ligase